MHWRSHWRWPFSPERFGCHRRSGRRRAQVRLRRGRGLDQFQSGVRFGRHGHGNGGDRLRLVRHGGLDQPESFRPRRGDPRRRRQPVRVGVERERRVDQLFVRQHGHVRRGGLRSEDRPFRRRLRRLRLERRGRMDQFQPGLHRLRRLWRQNRLGPRHIRQRGRGRRRAELRRRGGEGGYGRRRRRIFLHGFLRLGAAR